MRLPLPGLQARRRRAPGPTDRRLAVHRPPARAIAAIAAIAVVATVAAVAAGAVTAVTAGAAGAAGRSTGGAAAPPASARLSPAIARVAAAEPEQVLTAYVWLPSPPDAWRAATVNGAGSGSGLTRRQRHRLVIEALRRRAARRPRTLVRHLAELEASVAPAIAFRAHWLADVVAVRAPAAVLARLAARPDVDWIEPALVARAPPPVDEGGAGAAPLPLPLPPGLRAIRAPEVWHELGHTGAGRLIGILDSGVDGTHPGLASRWRGRSAPASTAWLDLVGDAETPVDPTGHGTRVLGIACGLITSSADTTGVAWGAEWIAAAAIGQPTGSEFDADVIAALEWLCDPDGDPATIEDVPDVVVCAFGVEPALPGDPPYRTCDDRFQQAIDHVEAAGVAIVWSAGNGGPEPASVASPADLAQGIGRNLAVGAVDATHSPFPYPVAPFSSRGPSDCDGVSIKPDLVAPGLSVRTTFPGPTVGNFSGTSAAAPHVAGVVALMRAAHPELDVPAIKDILLASTIDLATPGPDHDTGHGLIDARLAVELALAQAIAVAESPPSDRLRLAAPRPNPAAGAVAIEVELAAAGPLVLEIFSVDGRRVWRVDHGARTAGVHRLGWDRRDDRGRRAPAGVYFLRLAGRRSPVRKLVLLD